MASHGAGQLGEADLRLLRALQSEFPLMAQPYKVIAESLRLPEEEVLGRTCAFKTDGLIREITATFDTRCLGYHSALVAMQIYPARADEAASVVNEHPGVSHNYLREDSYNLWFTLAVPTGSQLGVSGTVAVLERLVGSKATLVLPSLRMFKLDLALPWGKGGSGEMRQARPPQANDSSPAAKALSERERAIVRVLQNDLPVASYPFRPLAEEARLLVERLLQEARGLQERGLMRRYGAVLHHRKAGYLANVMGVWAVEPERVEEVGRAMASFSFVSHCYQRPSQLGWPYTLYTMVHAASAAECQQMLRTLSERAGVSDYRALATVKEYKKEKIRYFSPDFQRWEAEHGASC